MSRNDYKTNFEPQRLIIVLSIIVLVLFWLLSRSFINNQENVFWGSIKNNLNTLSITRTIEQQQTGLEAKRTIFARSGKEFGVVSLIDINQETPNEKTTKVKTENITTTEKNIARYISVSSDMKDANSKPVDFSNIENKWFSEPTSSFENLEIIAEGLGLSPGVVAGTPPFILLSNNLQSTVNPIIKKAYKPDLSSVKTTTLNGKNVYVYQVSVDVYQYLVMLNTIRKNLGFEELLLDPEDFKHNEPFSLQMTIGVNSRQLYEAVDTNNDSREYFQNYGLDESIILQKAKYSKKDIETKLTKLINQ